MTSNPRFILVMNTLDPEGSPVHAVEVSTSFERLIKRGKALVKDAFVWDTEHKIQIYFDDGQKDNQLEVGLLGSDTIDKWIAARTVKGSGATAKGGGAATD